MKRTEPARTEVSSVPGVMLSGDQTLVELLDRLLNTGVVLAGDLTISVADIELVWLSLQVVLSSVETARQAGWNVPKLVCGPARAPTDRLVAAQHLETSSTQG
jgi:hypothetical protein